MLHCALRCETSSPWVPVKAACFHQLPSELELSQNTGGLRLVFPMSPFQQLRAGISSIRENSAASLSLCELLEDMKTILGETGLLGIVIKIQLGSPKGNNKCKKELRKPKEGLLRYAFVYSIYISRHHKIQSFFTFYK